MKVGLVAYRDRMPPKPHQHSTADCASFLLYLHQVIDDEWPSPALEVMDMIEERLFYLAGRDPAVAAMLRKYLPKRVAPSFWSDQP